MRKIILPSVLLLLSLGFCLSAHGKSPSLKVVIPEGSGLDVSIERIRIAGHTEPGNKVSINDREVKVYETGAFINMVPLSEGQNCIRIEAIGPRRETTRKNIIVNRLPKIETLPAEPLRISGSMMLPAQPYELGSGDVVYVRFLGTPGGQATFRIPGVEGVFPMAEVEPLSEDGLRGVYEGHYRVTGTEETKGLSKVEFALARSGQLVNRESIGTVSIEPERWPRVGEVIEEEVGLQAGLGQARLGGAELGFMPKGVRLQMTGRVGRLYHVRLTDTRDAWVDVDAIRLLPKGTNPPKSLTGRVNVRVNNGYDEIPIALDDPLPFLFDTEAGSNVLILDLFGAVSNFTWITNSLDTKQYESLSWHQIEKDCLRIRFALKHSQNWGFSARYEDETNNLVVRLKHPPKLGLPPNSVLKGLAIALDAGHGGRHNGALGSTELKEKDVNRKVVSILADLLERQGATVIWTRRGDETINQQDRYKRALEGKADLFVSIHSNSIGLSSDAAEVHGTSVYYKYPCYRAMTVPIYENLLGLGLKPYGLVSSFNFYPLKRTELPSVLVEVAFMSNPEEEAMLMKIDFQTRVAKSVLDGIEKFLANSSDERIR